MKVGTDSTKRTIVISLVVVAVLVTVRGGAGGNVAAGGKSGVLAISPHNPHYFQAADGRSVVLVGDYTWGTFSDVDYDYEAQFVALHANGLNFARV
ncbi:MAG: hypothetical protein NTX52_12030, partial [Planctomycetota bacterium]|nr:hypothetical protein [Planctomycetota bacterium]